MYLDLCIQISKDIRIRVFLLPYWRVIKRMCTARKYALNNEYFAQFYLPCAISFIHAPNKARVTMKCTLNKQYALISDVCLITYPYGSEGLLYVKIKICSN